MKCWNASHIYQEDRFDIKICIIFSRTQKCHFFRNNLLLIASQYNRIQSLTIIAITMAGIPNIREDKLSIPHKMHVTNDSIKKS